jgi:hypothetical protein
MERSIGHKVPRNCRNGRYLPTVNGYREEAMGLDDGQYYKSWVESSIQLKYELFPVVSSQTFIFFFFKKQKGFHYHQG